MRSQQIMSRVSAAVAQRLAYKDMGDMLYYSITLILYITTTILNNTLPLILLILNTHIPHTGYWIPPCPHPLASSCQLAASPLPGGHIVSAHPAPAHCTGRGLGRL